MLWSEGFPLARQTCGANQASAHPCMRPCGLQAPEVLARGSASVTSHSAPASAPAGAPTNDVEALQSEVHGLKRKLDELQVVFATCGTP